MNRFNDLPIRKKLMRIILMAGGMALLFTGIFILIYDWNTYRPKVVRNLSSIADLYNVTMPAPINFDDAQAANENLRTLKAQRDISMACVYKSDGSVMAKYIRHMEKASDCPTSFSRKAEHRFNKAKLLMFRPINFNGKVIGSLFLQYDLPPLMVRLLEYSLIAGAVLFSVVVVSLLLATELERSISGPILKLADTAQLISIKKEYGLRAKKNSNDEVGSLTDAFNKMLDAIEHSLKALRLSESRFRRVYESNMMGIMFCDLEGNVSEANDYFLQLIGYDREDLLSGRIKWTEMTPPAYQHLDVNALEELNEKQTFNVYEKEYIRKDGTRVPVLLGGAFLEDSKTDVVAFFLDMTERKYVEKERDSLLTKEQKARLEAEKALQMREDFMSIAAHELRTPLTPLKLQLDLIKSILAKQAADSPKSEILAKLINSSDQQISRLSRLIEDMLDVSRIRTGKLSLQLEQVDLSELIRDVLLRYQLEIEKLNTKVEMHIEKDAIGYWDRLRIEQVVINLLTNAMKYGVGKPFQVTVTKTGDMARLTVQDHGIGIADEDQGRIFDRFERAVSLQHFGGFGLGLYITRQIVEAHGGTIQVMSQLGSGSTFIVELPLMNTITRSSYDDGPHPHH